MAFIHGRRDGEGGSWMLKEVKHDDEGLSDYFAAFCFPSLGGYRPAP
jgi:hypothetical protein